ncbi:MAG: hypothetical protein J6Y85_01010 [Alphaproteobacteria bacterium]|nr:hypothetical protein [Alphaproteobacteria bacterium]
MKYISLFALLLGTSMMATAAVVPTASMPKTPVQVVDTSRKEIIVDVPEQLNYAEELKNPRFNNLRQFQGMEDAKYVRNVAKMLRDNPAALMKSVYNIDASAVDISAYDGKKALGTNREPIGVTMGDKSIKDMNWVDSLADVRFPDFMGDYNDLRTLQGEFRDQQQKGLEEIKKIDLKKKVRMAPIQQAL